MSTIGSIYGTTAGSVPQGGAAHVQTDPSAELAKLERQLSDWVDCPSGKTPAGKAHIDEITRQIDDVKAQMKKAEERKAPNAPVEGASPAGPGIRLDGTGTSLDVRA